MDNDAKYDRGVEKGYNKVLNSLQRLSVEDLEQGVENLLAQPVPKSAYVAGIQEGTYKGLNYLINKLKENQ